jgi:hypothetical protein
MTKPNPKKETRPTDEQIKKLANLKHSKDPSASDEENIAWATKVYPDIERRAYFYSKLTPAATRDENWYAAERDILKGITSDDLKEIEARIRGMIQHENDLLNHRIQWFLIINGFLLTATASLKAKPSGDTLLLLIILSLVGFLICISFWFSLGIGRRGVGRLADMWEHYRDLYYRHEEPTGSHQIGVLGWRSNVWASRLAPWYSLPIIFGFVWIFLFCTYLVSKPVAAEKMHQINIVRPGGQVLKIPVDTSQNSTTIIQLPNGEIGLDLLKKAPKIINKP